MREIHEHICLSFPIKASSHFICKDKFCIRPVNACWVCDGCLETGRKLIPLKIDKHHIIHNLVRSSPEK